MSWRCGNVAKPNTVIVTNAQVQSVLDEIERRGQAAHINNPDYSKGLAEAHELLSALLNQKPQ